MRTESTAYIYALSLIKGIGPRKIYQIVHAFPEPTDLSNASYEEHILRLGTALGKVVSESVRAEWSRLWKCANDAIIQHNDNGIQVVPANDPAYPSLLGMVPGSPPLLYVKGNLSILGNTPALSVVGTRNPTDRGKQIAHRIAFLFAQAGFTIVSGLAKGIDTEAHKGALDAGGATIAILGGPLDRIYPPENRYLAEHIVRDAGALISENPIGMEVSKGTFVQRNRIQAGLSVAVIAVQSDIEGGTMHTVRFAEKAGRPIICPKPDETEIHVPQYSGIQDLLSGDRATEFSEKGFDQILTMLRNKHQEFHSRNSVPMAGTHTPDDQGKSPNEHSNTAQLYLEAAMNAGDSPDSDPAYTQAGQVPDSSAVSPGAVSRLQTKAAPNPASDSIDDHTLYALFLRKLFDLIDNIPVGRQDICSRLDLTHKQVSVWLERAETEKIVSKERRGNKFYYMRAKQNLVIW